VALLAARSAVRSHGSIPEHLPVSPTSTSVIDIDGVGSTFDTNPGMIELVGKPARPGWGLAVVLNTTRAAIGGFDCR